MKPEKEALIRPAQVPSSLELLRPTRTKSALR
jgi:hypothetical protein